MLISVFGDPAQLASFTEQVAKLEWRDGAATAGPVARMVKRNLQADMGTAAARVLSQDLQGMLAVHPVLRAAAQPRRFSPLIISKTENGGHYGLHVDNALMKNADGEPLRSDLSFTLFLTPPDQYCGGELVIHSAGGAQEVKGDAGQMALYPSTALHEVRPVTNGARIVCVGWIESLVADQGQRDILFDLENLRASLKTSLPAQSPELLTLDKTIANLLRRWARP